MKKINLIHPDIFLNDFFKNFFYRQGFVVETDISVLDYFSKAKKAETELLIITKNIKSIDLVGFMIKKNLLAYLKYIPVFVIGEFSTIEITKLKEQGVKAFISPPLNPYALLERIHIYFKINKEEEKHKTPMLLDINIKNKIFIIQIEANLELDKIDLMIYNIRKHCFKNKIKDPKFFFIIPSLYPETITIENLYELFSIMKLTELNIPASSIKILCKIKEFVDLIQNSPELSGIEIVKDYITGINLLNIDIDRYKKISIDFLIPGTSFILDLYDDNNNIMIPARTKIAEEKIEYLRNIGIQKLTYFSELTLEELLAKSDQTKNNQSNTGGISGYNDVDYLSDFTTIDDDATVDINVNKDKMSLFFKKIEGLSALVITMNKTDAGIIYQSLKKYLTVNIIDNSTTLNDYLENEKLILIFIDENLFEDNAIDILRRIRARLTRRKTTVIIISNEVNRTVLHKYKEAGTDYLILSPFTKEGLLQKVHRYILNDRKF